MLAAAWGAGNSTIPLAAGSARGTAVQETVIKVVLYTAAPTVLISLAVILWAFVVYPLSHWTDNRNDLNVCVLVMVGLKEAETDANRIDAD